MTTSQLFMLEETGLPGEIAIGQPESLVPFSHARSTKTSSDEKLLAVNCDAVDHSDIGANPHPEQIVDKNH